MADSVSGLGGIKYIDKDNKENSTNGLSVDSNTFMQLLVAQMQYQDPLEPQTNTDFVAQLAQFTSLEQMQLMNQSMSASQATGLVGKLIYAEVLNSESGVTEAYSGIVDSIIMQKGSSLVVVGGTAIPLENVLMVSENIPSSDQSEAPQNT